MRFIRTSGESGRLTDTWGKGGQPNHGPPRGLGPRNSVGGNLAIGRKEEVFREAILDMLSVIRPEI